MLRLASFQCRHRGCQTVAKDPVSSRRVMRAVALERKLLRDKPSDLRNRDRIHTLCRYGPEPSCTASHCGLRICLRNTTGKLASPTSERISATSCVNLSAQAMALFASQRHRSLDCRTPQRCVGRHPGRYSSSPPAIALDRRRTWSWSRWSARTRRPPTLYFVHVGCAPSAPRRDNARHKETPSSHAGHVHAVGVYPRTADLPIPRRSEVYAGEAKDRVECALLL